MFHEENRRQNKKLHISRPTPQQKSKKHCKERTKLIFGRSVVDFALVFEGAPLKFSDSQALPGTLSLKFPCFISQGFPLRIP